MRYGIIKKMKLGSKDNPEICEKEKRNKLILKRNDQRLEILKILYLINKFLQFLK